MKKERDNLKHKQIKLDELTNNMDKRNEKRKEKEEKVDYEKGENEKKETKNEHYNKTDVFKNEKNEQKKDPSYKEFNLITVQNNNGPKFNLKSEY